MAAAITYVGHSTVLIELDGVRILTDPLLRPRIAHVRRIVAPPRVEQLAPLDAVLVSHAHHDHLDPPSLQLLPSDTRVVASAACLPLLRRRGFTRVEAVGEGDTVRVGSVEVAAVPAVHDGRRYPFGEAKPAVGFVIEGDARVYFAGDTDVYDGMSEAAGGVDAALLPVWGWGPRVPAGHMDPVEAARAVGLIRPRVVVPIHWGTYAAPRVRWLSHPDWPAREFERHVRERVPGVDVRVLVPGERLAL